MPYLARPERRKSLHVEEPHHQPPCPTFCLIGTICFVMILIGPPLAVQRLCDS